MPPTESYFDFLSEPVIPGDHKRPAETTENDKLERNENEKRILALINSLRLEKEHSMEIGLRPRVAFLADSNHIENQQIDIVYAPDLDQYQISFKLTSTQRQKLPSRFFESRIDETGDKNEDGSSIEEIEYSSCTDPTRKTRLCKARTQKRGGYTIKTAQALEEDRYGDRHNVLSALGLVVTEIPASMIDENPEEMLRIIQNTLAELMVPDALQEPDSEAMRDYKRARYCWHHKIPETDYDEKNAAQLERVEVFPGYWTMVENGKSKEYKEISKFAVYHKIYSASALVKIIKAGGLLSTQERFNRGLISSGMSSAEDLNTGGADSVFTRIITEAGLSKRGGQFVGEFYDGGDSMIVFNEDVLDRTDWYAYASDKYGSIKEDLFSTRQSPTELFKDQAGNGFNDSNEQMFRRGISLSQIKGIMCDRISRDNNIRILKEAGIFEVNGRPVEEFIVLGRRYVDMIKLVNNVPQNEWFLGKEFIDVNGNRVETDGKESVNNIKVGQKLKVKPEHYDYVMQDILSSKTLTVVGFIGTNVVIQLDSGEVVRVSSTGVRDRFETADQISNTVEEEPPSSSQEEKEIMDILHEEALEDDAIPGHNIGNDENVDDDFGYDPNDSWGY